VLKPIMLAATAVLFIAPAMAQTPPPKPVATKVTATNTMTTKKTVTRTAAKPRTAKSLACSRDADAKNLHGAPREKFMRSCNKG